MANILDAPNPFVMPSDEQVFVLREEERRRKAEERDQLKNRKVYEKTTASNRIGTARISNRELAVDEMGDARTADSLARAQRGGYGSAKRVTAVEKGPPEGGDVPRDKENMASFIAKKREMGLTRMSLATKRHEIRKLEEEAEKAEKRIKQQEEQLEETVRKFEDFLKENDMKAVEAMKKAEHETKGKQEKTAEIKRLSAQIAAITSEKAKYEEHMQFCLRYKKFLDQLTPAGWFRDTLCTIEIHRVREELEKQMAEQFAAMALQEDAEPAAIAMQQTAALAAIDEKVEAARVELKGKLDELPDAAVVAELNVLDPDVVPMYFTEPEKILNTFMEIEENNLFLIQNCQETEESLEELKSKFNEAKQKMDEEAASLKTQIEQIRQKIAIEDQKKKLLMHRMSSSREAQNNEELVQSINSKVTEIFKATGFGDNDANINTLGMLTKVETKLEELRLRIISLPNDFVLGAMKQRDKERRQKARQKLLDEQRLQREMRSHKALARSQAPVKKMVGKPVMWRSRPLDKKQTVITDVADDGDGDDAEFFS
eukprot:GGOE01005719.1.p1 GENE.GGOE01005719.1~~GGOE01005719.1.p1  ORF type:complete len:573 (-),score=247.52 GGOE01005719.1:417-2048(-)